MNILTMKTFCKIRATCHEFDALLALQNFDAGIVEPVKQAPPKRKKAK